MERFIGKCDEMLVKAWTAFRGRVVEPLRRAAGNEDGDIVQTVLIIGLFVVIVVAVVAILRNALVNKAGEIGNAISGQNFTP